MWYVNTHAFIWTHTMTSYSAVKKEILPFGTTWVDLSIMPSEGRQTEKGQCHILSLMCGI